jgi:hypothetical protein
MKLLRAVMKKGKASMALPRQMPLFNNTSRLQAMQMETETDAPFKVAHEIPKCQGQGCEFLDPKIRMLRQFHVIGHGTQTGPFDSFHVETETPK